MTPLVLPCEATTTRAGVAEPCNRVAIAWARDPIQPLTIPTPPATT